MMEMSGGGHGRSLAVVMPPENEDLVCVSHDSVSTRLLLLQHKTHNQCLLTADINVCQAWPRLTPLSVNSRYLCSSSGANVATSKTSISSSVATSKTIVC